MCFHPRTSCFFFLPKVSQQILNMQCHGKSTYNEYIFMRISTNPYHLQRRKKVLLNSQEKRQEEQKRNFIPSIKTPTFSLNLNTMCEKIQSIISMRYHKASLLTYIFLQRFDCSTRVN